MGEFHVLLDERADVFALGSILCEVLTGRPAFTGRNVGEIHRKAALGDLAGTMAASRCSRRRTDRTLAQDVLSGKERRPLAC